MLVLVLVVSELFKSVHPRNSDRIFKLLKAVAYTNHHRGDWGGGAGGGRRSLKSISVVPVWGGGGGGGGGGSGMCVCV